ncbi:MAG: hypothetical protein ACW972_06765, partial [Promethearchaeota archaeon]
ETWPKARWHDYLKINLCSYFNLPKNINFLNNPNFDREPGIKLFNDYLGGIYSESSFCDKYKLDKKLFNDLYQKTLSEFTPKKKLLDLISDNTKIDLAVHLRRTDKINSSPNHVEIHNQELKNLDDMTLQSVFNEINNSKRNLNIYVCSDCEKSKNSFIEKISSKCTIIKTPKVNFEFEKTYVDLYLLSISGKIIMSQKHSNFSCFASSLNNAELVYFYEDNEFINSSSSNRFKLFKEMKNENS